MNSKTNTKNPYGSMSVKPVKAQNTDHIQKINCIRTEGIKDLRSNGVNVTR